MKKKNDGMKRIFLIVVIVMSAVCVRGENEFVSEKACIDGIWYETFMPSRETVPSNGYGYKRNCASVISVGEGEIYARVIRNEDEESVPISGEVVIPSHVTINGKDYEVIATGKNSLGSLADGARVILPSTIKIIGKNSIWAKYEIEWTNTSIAIYFDDAYVKLPESVMVVEENCFYGMKVDEQIYLPNLCVMDYEAMCYINNAKKLTFGPNLTTMRDYAIPNADELVFEDGNEDALKWDDTHSANHTYIGTGAISDSSVKEIKLPKWENLTLYDRAISCCENLERVIFPDIKTINYGFHLTLNDAMSKPFWGIFFDHCTNLKEVVCMGSIPPDIVIKSDFYEYIDYRGTSNEFEFMDNRDDCVLKVPAGSEDLYRAAPVWGRFKTIMGFENGDYTSVVMPEIIMAGDEEMPVYHNMQGIRVNHPQKGRLYIRTIGSRTDKVIY